MWMSISWKLQTREAHGLLHHRLWLDDSSKRKNHQSGERLAPPTTTLLVSTSVTSTGIYVIS